MVSEQPDLVVPAAKTRIYWGYEDLGILFVTIAFISSTMRLVSRISALGPFVTASRGLWQQLLVTGLMSLGLVSVLKIRHGKPVLGPLGWRWPSGLNAIIAVLGGVGLAVAVYASTRIRHMPVTTSSPVDLVVLGLLAAPLLEETMFRGFLLPLLAQSLGNGVAVMLTALVFALLHGPADALHWFWITSTGVVYGLIRIRSESTLSSAVMHGLYNVTLGCLFRWFPF